MLAGVREHPGMESISFSPITRSILARFNPHEISREEIVLRVAFHLSLDCGSAPVRLLAEPEQRPALGGSAAVSAAALALSLAMRGLKQAKGSPTRWDWLAGLGTAWAVVGPRLEGASRAQAGSIRKSSPWLTSSPPSFAATSSRPRSSSGWRPSDGTWSRLLPPACKSGPWSERRGNGRSGYEVMIGPDVDAPERVRMLSALQGLLKYAITGGGAQPFRTLLEELQDVSKVHGEVLEGFGRMPQGIPMRFNFNSRQ